MPQETLTVEQARALARKNKKPTQREKALKMFTQALPELSREDTEAQRKLFERHAKAAWTIRLPLGPSVNSYRTISHGRRFTTLVEGQVYHEVIARLWIAHWSGKPPEPLTGRLRLTVSIVFKSKPPPDLDNRIKPLQDALVNAGAFGDDNQIDDIRIVRSPVVCKPGWMDVTIETIQGE